MATTDIVVKNVTIANGAALSTALEVPESYYLTAIVKDNTLDTSIAITFQVSLDGVTYVPLYDDGGNAVSVTCQAATAEALALETQGVNLAPWKYIKFAVADNQTGITTLQCVLRGE